MTRRSLVCAWFVLAGSVASVACRPLVADDAPAGDDGPLIEVRVSDTDGAPVSDAAIGGTINRKVTVGKTDAEGVYRLTTPTGSLDTVTVTVTKQGFAPMRWIWRKTAGEELPRTMPFALEKTSPIGGIVRDEQDKPIARATVSLVLPNSSNRQPRAWLANSTAKTDAEGHWHFDNMPSTASDIWIRLSHPDFISDDIYNTTPRPPIEQLRDRSGVMVMRHGVAISGRVLDEQGNPIVGATVRQGYDHFGSNYPEVKTNEQGEFRFPQSKAGETALTAQAPGRAPDVKEINVTDKPVDNVEFRLGPGRTVRGRVVDIDGNPVAGAFVAADTWRQKRSLKWRVDTDKEGRFTWNEAPSDDVLIDLGKQGFMSVRHFSLKGTDEDVTITLNRPLTVSGRVVDDTTGEPLARFQVTRGIVFPGGRGPSWQHHEDKPGTGGQFTTTFAEPHNEFVIRVEALGHAPALSRTFKPTDGPQEFEFRLKPATAIAGVVRDTDGKPLANVQVAMISGSLGLQISRGRIASSGATETSTAEDGTFEFPPQADPYLLLVADERGFAKAPQAVFETNHELKVQPWGRLEGRAKLGKLGPNGNISFNGQHERVEGMPSINCYETTTADAEGRFSFDHLVPGTAYVGLSGAPKRVANGMTTTPTLRGLSVEIEAGKTVTANIGGEGRSVAGRLVNGDGSEPSDWNPTNGSLQLKSPFEKLPFPENWATMSLEEKKAWYTAFAESAEGKEFMKQQRLSQRNYPAPIDPDGRFQLEAIPPGDYRLHASVYSSGVPGKMIGRVTHEFTVPDAADKSSDDVVDLGSIKITPFHDLAVGEQAPDFTAETVAGESFTLSGLKGKFVLLDFWATWCGPCIAEIPHLREVQEAFGKHDRFAMVSLSLDDERKTAADYVEREKLNWTQVHLGAWANSPTPEKYGVLGIPAIFLIGPDGKVLAKNLRGPAIKAKIIEVLGELPAEKAKD